MSTPTTMTVEDSPTVSTTIYGHHGSRRGGVNYGYYYWYGSESVGPTVASLIYNRLRYKIFSGLQTE